MMPLESPRIIPVQGVEEQPEQEQIELLRKSLNLCKQMSKDSHHKLHENLEDTHDEVVLGQERFVIDDGWK